MKVKIPKNWYIRAINKVYDQIDPEEYAITHIDINMEFGGTDEFDDSVWMAAEVTYYNIDIGKQYIAKLRFKILDETNK